MTLSKSATKGLSTAIDFEVKPPFQIMEDNRRRFIRIDVDEPVSFRVIKSAEGGYWPAGDGPYGEGEILNISAGGILMFTTTPVMQRSLLSMSLQVEGCLALENVLGLVKRAEIDSGGYLIGVESITREKLCDIMSEEELSQLPQGAASFTEQLQLLLNQYIHSRKLSSKDNE